MSQVGEEGCTYAFGESKEVNCCRDCLIVSKHLFFPLFHKISTLSMYLAYAAGKTPVPCPFYFLSVK